MSCIFCDVPPERVVWRNHTCFAVRDEFPVSRGHTLVIPHGHVPSWFDASPEQRLGLLEGIDAVRAALDPELRPDGYNVGFNCGAAAGQTVFHLHVHVIPRYAGDMPDPRGGVRHVIPGKGRWAAEKAPHADALVAGASVPACPDPLIHHLRPYFREADQVDVLVAFLLGSGLERIEDDLRSALDRGARVRVVTGDYLEITDARALRRLLALDARLEAFVFESRLESFHPKAWIFRMGGDGVAFVGSSNMSWSALVDGIEWNLRITARENPAGFSDVCAKFESLLGHPQMRRITADWIDRYEAQVARSIGTSSFSAVVPGDVERDLSAVGPPAPNSVQEEALEALRAARASGVRRGLVVLATGLGKTYLAAFDSAGFGRVLFIAHREEILAQAMRTFQRVRPDSKCAMYVGGSAFEAAERADVVFASVQTLGRLPHLERFAADHFDYVVMDEFHHAAAATYRRVLDWFGPAFLLGLTATPERADGADLLKLCDGNLIYHCDVAEGVDRDLLCPFTYFGVPDEVDYANIPWRSGRFDPDSLDHALATEKRAQNALDQWREKGGRRTLAFCCSVRHADFMAEFFGERGVASAPVHSGDSSAPRALSLAQLERGELQVVFTVDLFNEGLDVPEIDTVLMLRPTESRVIWLQQFGRGLRRSPGKDRLRVIDYIGNHRAFLVKPQAMFGLPQGDSWVARLIKDARMGTLVLPHGCDVVYDVVALDLLESILKKDRTQELRFFYEDFVEFHGRRPRAVEVFLAGFNPRAARKFHGSWLGFVDGMGGMEPEGREAFSVARGFLEDLEKTPMEKSYKMAVLLGMLMVGAVPGRVGVDRLTDAVHGVLQGDPRLRDDFLPDAREGGRRLEALLLKNPLHFLTTGPSRQFFSLEGDVFAATVPVPEGLREPFQALGREVVEWRLEDYMQRPGKGLQLAPGVSRCKVVRNASGNPIIMLDRANNPQLPSGTAPVRVDGDVYKGNFAKIALNALYPAGSRENRLPEILRTLFGRDAGAPGRQDRLDFVQDGGGLLMRSQASQ